MQVSRWGNSLAVRLSSTLVKVLDLKPGDRIELEAYSRKKFAIRKLSTRLQAIENLRKLRRPFPPDYKFDREQANER